MIPIRVSTIGHKEQRYDTVGDWYDLDSQAIVKVSNLGDSKMEFCVAVHEMVEQYLCREHGISDEEVSAFDKAHLDHPNPGDLKEAPYHKEHVVASMVEMLLVKELGINLEEYERKLLECG